VVGDVPRRRATSLLTVRPVEVLRACTLSGKARLASNWVFVVLEDGSTWTRLRPEASGSNPSRPELGSTNSLADGSGVVADRSLRTGRPGPRGGWHLEQRRRCSGATRRIFKAPSRPLGQTPLSRRCLPLIGAVSRPTHTATRPVDVTSRLWSPQARKGNAAPNLRHHECYRW